MKTLINDKHAHYVFGAWLLLMTLTAGSWWLRVDSELAGLGRHLSVIGILVLTFAKIYVVGSAFMELREAAPWLTRTFTAWCVGLCAVLSGMYLAI